MGWDGMTVIDTETRTGKTTWHQEHNTWHIHDTEQQQQWISGELWEVMWWFFVKIQRAQYLFLIATTRRVRELMERACNIMCCVWYVTESQYHHILFKQSVIVLSLSPLCRFTCLPAFISSSSSSSVHSYIWSILTSSHSIRIPSPSSCWHSYSYIIMSAVRSNSNPDCGKMSWLMMRSWSWSYQAAHVFSWPKWTGHAWENASIFISRKPILMIFYILVLSNVLYRMHMVLFLEHTDELCRTARKKATI